MRYVVLVTLLAAILSGAAGVDHLWHQGRCSGAFRSKKVVTIGTHDYGVEEYGLRHLFPDRRVFPGDKVMAQWTGGSYYPGTITAVRNGQYMVTRDDGSPPLWRTLAQVNPDNGYALRTGHFIIGPVIALMGGILAQVFFGTASERKHSDDLAAENAASDTGTRGRKCEETNTIGKRNAAQQGVAAKSGCAGSPSAFCQLRSEEPCNNAQ